MLLFSLVLAFGAAPLGAQTLYRIVGPDGRITFSDKPPVRSPAEVTPLSAPGANALASVNLPFGLRQAAEKYPVTLFTGPSCAPCDQGRRFLQERGIPFSEKTISTPEDAQSLQRLSNASSLPLLTLGAQQLLGFSPTEWGQYLTAAGYPEKSQLPAAYRNPPPSPLVSVQEPTPASAPKAAAPDTPAAAVPPAPPASPRTSADNPAGIQF